MRKRSTLNRLSNTIGNYASAKYIHSSASPLIAYDGYFRQESVSDFNEALYPIQQSIMMGTNDTKDLIDRKKIIENLRAELQAPSRDDVTKMLVIGPKGASKSTTLNMLMAKDAENKLNNGEMVTSVIFKGDQKDIENQYKEFASRLKISVGNSIDSKLVDAVNNILKDRGKPLFIFDDIERIENPHEFISKLTPQSLCEIIMVTKDPSVLPYHVSSKIRTVDLNSSEYRFTQAQAIDLINRTLGGNHHELDCHKKILAENLNYLPGPIIEVTEFAKRNCISFRSLIDNIHKHSFVSKIQSQRNNATLQR